MVLLAIVWVPVAVAAGIIMGVAGTFLLATRTEKNGAGKSGGGSSGAKLGTLYFTLLSSTDAVEFRRHGQGVAWYVLRGGQVIDQGNEASAIAALESAFPSFASELPAGAPISAVASWGSAAAIPIGEPQGPWSWSAPGHPSPNGAPSRGIAVRAMVNALLEHEQMPVPMPDPLPGMDAHDGPSPGMDAEMPPGPSLSGGGGGASIDVGEGGDAPVPSGSIRYFRNRAGIGVFTIQVDRLPTSPPTFAWWVWPPETVVQEGTQAFRQTGLPTQDHASVAANQWVDGQQP